jgi:hypothetical protein
MPTPVSIAGRSSSITNSFINSIIPVIPPSEEEIVEALTILGMNPADVRCVYCGDAATEWDHLRPLVVDQRPTGFISEIGNLVPACGKCNQSKGNKPWRAWMRSSAPRSPCARGIKDIDERVQRLEQYEAWRPSEPVNFRALVGDELWNQHWENWRHLLDAMRSSQELAARIRNRVRELHASEPTNDEIPASIPDDALRVDMIPASGADWDEIQRFALTFDGYAYWGSFERCEEVAEERRSETLTDLRTCLFFEQRRWRHYGYEPDEQAMAYIRYLVEQIRARVRSSENAPLTRA